MEIQFKEHAMVDKEEDCMAQITFHFPGAELIETEDGDEQYTVAPAEAFRNSIMELGVIKNITDKVIVEFTKEQGIHFVTRSLPRSVTHFFNFQAISSHHVANTVSNLVQLKCTWREPSICTRSTTKISVHFSYYQNPTVEGLPSSFH